MRSMGRENSGIETAGQEGYHMGMNTTPKRPLSDDDETLRILADRDKTFDNDRKDAEPWQAVKTEILRTLKHPAPR
jgi:hypothetical protein